MPRPLLVVSLLLLFAADVRAQRCFTRSRILDWMAADSQVVVRAVVVDFVDEVDGAKQKWNTVVIRVRATLKGKHKPFHTYVIPDWGHEKLAGWKKTQQELLVFLADTKAPDASQSVVAQEGGPVRADAAQRLMSVIETGDPRQDAEPFRESLHAGLAGSDGSE